MASLSPYLSFNGNCREALHFYQSCFGGDLNLMRIGDSPMASHVPADAQDHIIYGTLTTPTILIQATDAGVLGGSFAVGDNVAIGVDCLTEAEIDTLFEKLSEGGHIHTPLGDMFWGGKFGAITDRFDTSWRLNYQRDQREAVA